MNRFIKFIGRVLAVLLSAVQLVIPAFLMSGMVCSAVMFIISCCSNNVAMRFAVIFWKVMLVPTGVMWLVMAVMVYTGIWAKLNDKSNKK